MGGAATKVAPNPDGGVEVRTPETLQWQDPTRIFKEVDVDSNQSISSDELKSALQKQGYDDVVFATLMGELDVDSDGCIAFDEWRKGFYASSFVHVRPSTAEDFGDLHMRTYSGIVQWGGCTIAETAKRAITVAQLERVYSHIDRRCKPEGWADKSGNQRTPGTVTLYDAARFVIKPATYVKQCSFVELIAFEEQVPLYFVSHWWGESVLDFVKCLKQHAVDRVLGVDSPYWVCAYANNQWKLDDEIGGSLEESSFRKAMKLSFGTVTVLDEGGITFSRIWCGYEIFTSLAGDSHKTYDVYTCPKQGGAVGLVEGLSAGDINAGAKQKRESAFPLERVRLDIQLQSAQASVEADRKAILNAIVGAAADAEPPEEHASYTRLNNMLAGRFAAGMVRTVIARGKKLDPYFAAIKASAATSLVIDLSNLIKCTDKELKLLTAALPNSLESLNLQLKGSKATEEGVTALFKHVCNLPRMRRLESDALTSTHMPLVMKMAMLEEFPARGRLFPCAMALINAAAKCAATLKSLDVSLDSRFRDGAPAGPAGAAALALGLAANSALTKLSLASTFLGEEGTKAICEALKQNKTLKELDLSGCDNIGRAAGAKHVADMLGVNGAIDQKRICKSSWPFRGVDCLCLPEVPVASNLIG
jgi:hypothetical protein